MSVDTELRTVTIWGGTIELRVQVRGSGPPILYLHPAGGLTWDGFLDDLAADHTIYAPEFPGTSPGDPMAIDRLDDMFDVVLAYEEAVRELGLMGSVVIGQSFGGMLAADLAATFPDLFSKVVLLDAAGLWIDDHPAPLSFMSSPPDALPAILFHDTNCAAAQAMFGPPADPDAGLDAAVGLVWAIGCTAKFLWPIPDRGLRKRLHRLTAPTLVVWGENDSLIPAAYAHEFGRLIAESRVELVPNCGHIPQLEQPQITTRLVRDFLADGSSDSVSE